MLGRFQGIIGIILILSIVFALSNNRSKINKGLVIKGLILQFILAIVMLKIHWVTVGFQKLGLVVSKLEYFSRFGADFVARGLAVFNNNGQIVNFANSAHEGYVFFINLGATFIFLCIIVAIFYQLGVIQFVISFIAKCMRKIMNVSGSESLSNIASAFVGQVEAQLMIRPYLKNMTKSEILASMTGSLACISGSILIVYANMGAKVEFLLAASIMAAPGGLIISKILYPETEVSETYGSVKLAVKKPYMNLLDAISHGATDGMKLSVNVFCMLIGFIALIALINYILSLIYPPLSLDFIFSKLFYVFAWAMGVPTQDISNVAIILGQKISINEFVAFNSLTSNIVPVLSEKGRAITTFAITGFANFSSMGILIGGIGAICPERKEDISNLAFKALLCGTLASFMSASIAGILM